VKSNIFCLCFFLVVQFQFGQPAEAGWGKMTIDSGAGDQVVVKHGLLGRKTVVEDRLGDGFATSHSIIGTKTTEVSVLGNGVRYHKGLLGFSSASAHTMLGDSLSTHKGLFYRTTNVNVSGINSLLGHYLHPESAINAPLPQGGGVPVPEANQRLEPPQLNQDQRGYSEAFPNQGN
jgi:hypothetical protein